MSLKPQQANHPPPSIEFLRFFHSLWINWDKQMIANDTGARARSTTLNEELGQIEYIFSDKTGTLTQNIMTFNKASIRGRSYGTLYDSAGEIVEPNASTPKCDFSIRNPNYAEDTFLFYDQALLDEVWDSDKNCDVHDYFRLLALCHTVMPEVKGSSLIYQAQSPDEGALVAAARNFGFVFLARTPNSITFECLGEVVTAELLCILDFNNVRKRMSVIVKYPDSGKIELLCKGADSVILERLADNAENRSVRGSTMEHLNNYAAEGLRTLVLAHKVLSLAEYEAWAEEYKLASEALENREEKVDRVGGWNCSGIYCIFPIFPGF